MGEPLECLLNIKLLEGGDQSRQKSTETVWRQSAHDRDPTGGAPGVGSTLLRIRILRDMQQRAGDRKRGHVAPSRQMNRELAGRVCEDCLKHSFRQRGGEQLGEQRAGVDRQLARGLGDAQPDHRVR